MSANGAQGGSPWRKASLAGAAVGVVAAGAAAGVAVERLTVGRGMRRKARLALDSTGPYGTLRGTPGRVTTDDGAVLHYEVDELASDGAPPLRRRRLFGRRTPPPVTVVFTHGYCLNQDSWHFQRGALRGVVRSVYWDQRSHGRSERAPAEAGPVSMERLGKDLLAVIEAAAPEGPLVLVGHSMGGMTVMALAGLDPDLVRERVRAVAFVCSSSGKVGEVDFGLPLAGVEAVRRLLPGTLKLLGRRVELVERGRRATADLFTGVFKRYSFGSADVDPAVARFAERMIESTPIDVVADFYPAIAAHDKTDALEVFAPLPALVVAGDRDMVLPSGHSELIAAALPNSELVVVPDGAHLVMLEHPEVVTDRLAELLVRAGVPGAGATVGDHGPSSTRSRS